MHQIMSILIQKPNNKQIFSQIGCVLMQKVEMVVKEEVVHVGVSDGEDGMWMKNSMSIVEVGEVAERGRGGGIG